MKIFGLKVVAGITIAIVILSLRVNAADVKQVLDTNNTKIEAAVESQKIVDKNYDETEKLLFEFRNTNRQIDGLKIYTDQLSQQIKKQQQILFDLDYSMSQISITERQLPALMQTMLQRLEQFIELDAPFHRQERRQRIEMLKASLARVDLSLAEKFRQLLEAYKIENEYGRKIDSYSDTIIIDGQARKVDILRVGRIALLYQTRDRALSGVWDRAAKTWQPLDNDDYRNAIIRGIRVAKNQAAIELLELPVPSVEASQ